MEDVSPGSDSSAASAEGLSTSSRTRRILITGSREWPKPAWVMDTLVEYMTENLTEDVKFIVVQGEARGADLQAKDCAKALKEAGWPVTYERHPADWQKHGRRAGFLRNEKMVRLGADVCLAFILNDSRGATMCRDLAAKAGIPIREYRINRK